MQKILACELQIGDMIRITCEDKSRFENGHIKVFEGTILSTFNAFDKTGDNWCIEIKSGTQWWLYKEKIDGGDIYLVKRGIKSK